MRNHANWIKGFLLIELASVIDTLVSGHSLRYGLTWEIAGLTREIGARGWKLGWHGARRSPQLRPSLLAR